MPHPHMNHCIDALARDRRGFEKRYYLCDLCWPDASLCVEYDSDQEHTGSDRIAQDALRRNDLTYQGITVVTATRKQMADPWKLERLAHQLAKFCTNA